VPRHPSIQKPYSSSLSPSFSLSLSLSLSLSRSLTGEEGVRTLFTSQREREREQQTEKERGGESVACMFKQKVRACSTFVSIPHSVSQSVSMRDYIIYNLSVKLRTNKLDCFSLSFSALRYSICIGRVLSRNYKARQGLFGHY
jgi:hypothetical protein